MDIFVAMYIVVVGVVAGYLFIRLCQKCWQVPASIVVVTMLLLMIIFVTPAKGETDFFGIEGNVVEKPVIIDSVEYKVKEIERDVWLIPVDTEYGIICFYADRPTFGRVYMLCFGKNFEVIDVIVFDDLEKPFMEEPSGSLLFLF